MAELTDKEITEQLRKSASELNSLIEDLHERGLVVGVNVASAHQFGQHGGRPIVQVTVLRPL